MNVQLNLWLPQEAEPFRLANKINHKVIIETQLIFQKDKITFIVPGLTQENNLETLDDYQMVQCTLGVSKPLAVLTQDGHCNRQDWDEWASAVC